MSIPIDACCDQSVLALSVEGYLVSEASFGFKNGCLSDDLSRDDEQHPKAGYDLSDAHPRW